MKRIILKLFFILVIGIVFVDGYQDLASADCHRPRCEQTCSMHASVCGSHMTVPKTMLLPVSATTRYFFSEEPAVISLSIAASVFHPPKILA
jgi:hypothetical protein